MPNQDPTRDSPRGCLIASGMFAKARTGQYPSIPYLGLGGPGRNGFGSSEWSPSGLGSRLETIGKGLHPGSQSFKRLRDFGIGLGFGDCDP